MKKRQARKAALVGLVEASQYKVVRERQGGQPEFKRESRKPRHFHEPIDPADPASVERAIQEARDGDFRALIGVLRSGQAAAPAAAQIAADIIEGKLKAKRGRKKTTRTGVEKVIDDAQTCALFKRFEFHRRQVDIPQAALELVAAESGFTPAQLHHRFYDSERWKLQDASLPDAEREAILERLQEKRLIL